MDEDESNGYVDISNDNSDVMWMKMALMLPRIQTSLSLDENVRAKEGGKETTGETALRLPSVPFPWSLAVHHQSLAFGARLYDTKNEAPEEKAGLDSNQAC